MLYMGYTNPVHEVNQQPTKNVVNTHKVVQLINRTPVQEIQDQTVTPTIQSYWAEALTSDFDQDQIYLHYRVKQNEERIGVIPSAFFPLEFPNLKHQLDANESSASQQSYKWLTVPMRLPGAIIWPFPPQSLIQAQADQITDVKEAVSFINALFQKYYTISDLAVDLQQRINYIQVENERDIARRLRWCRLMTLDANPDKTVNFTSEIDEVFKVYRTPNQPEGGFAGEKYFDFYQNVPVKPILFRETDGKVVVKIGIGVPSWLNDDEPIGNVCKEFEYSQVIRQISFNDFYSNNYQPLIGDDWVMTYFSDFDQNQIFDEHTNIGDLWVWSMDCQELQISFPNLK